MRIVSLFIFAFCILNVLSFNFFHNEGVDIVCLTLGSKGVKLSQKGKGIIQMPAIKIDKVML